MKRVLLGSMSVGGGHNALRDSFLEVLKDADPSGQTFELESYTVKDQRISAFYDWTVHHIPWFQRVVWDLSKVGWGVRLSILTNRPLLDEVTEVLAKHKPDVIVSSHLVLSMMFAKARRRLGLDCALISAIPDYGEPTLAFYPEAEDLQADYTICMDRNALRTLLEKFQAPRTRVHLSGFIPRAPFVDVGKKVGDADRMPHAPKMELLAQLIARHPELARFDPEKKTLLFLGGSAWTEKTMPVLDQIIRNPEFAEHLNVLVVSGKNEPFQQALSARVAQANLQRFFVFGFVSPEDMAQLMGLSDLPVLGSLAPASMHELLETRCGPMMLFHYIPGSEDAHGEWISRHEVGLYEPDAFLMTDLLMQATGFKPARAEVKRLLEIYPERARAIRRDHAERAWMLPEFVAQAGRVVPLRGPSSNPAWGSSSSRSNEVLRR